MLQTGLAPSGLTVAGVRLYQPFKIPSISNIPTLAFQNISGQNCKPKNTPNYKFWNQKKNRLQLPSLISWQIPPPPLPFPLMPGQEYSQKRNNNKKQQLVPCKISKTKSTAGEHCSVVLSHSSGKVWFQFYLWFVQDSGPLDSGFDLGRSWNC